MRNVMCLVCLGATLTGGIVAPVSAAPQQPVAEARTAPAPAPVLNLNTATAAQLDKLPGVGPATAARIIEYRQKNGGFKKVEELMNVRGIGEKGFLKLKNQITVTTSKADNQ